MQIRPEAALNYITPTGRDPYRRWYTRIKDEKTRVIITSRIEMNMESILKMHCEFQRLSSQRSR